MADERLPRDPLRREALEGVAAGTAGAAVHPSARPFGLFAARRRAAAVEDRRPCGARIDAPAIAVTDTNNLFGALEFAQKAVKEGVQPIIGCQLDFAFRRRASESLARHAPAAGPRALPARADRGRPRPATAIWSAGQPRLSRDAARRGRASAARDGSTALPTA